MAKRAQILLVAVTALLLLGLFSAEIYDTDFWWHLRTGQYIVETRSLPAPDPFAWTTVMARDTYAGESRTRRFNLTHEWLAQAMLYGVWRSAGFVGVVAMRAASMTVACGLIGLAAWRRRKSSCGAANLGGSRLSGGASEPGAVPEPAKSRLQPGLVCLRGAPPRGENSRKWSRKNRNENKGLGPVFSRVAAPQVLLVAVAAAMAAASVLAGLALDRPYQVTFLFLAATLAVLEYRRWMWLLPPLFVIWANCHGGYFLGWVVLGAHCAESLVRRERAARLWAVSAACLAGSAVNPNGLAIFRTLLDYRASFMQSKLLEWTPPKLWPLSWFSALLFASAVVLALAWRRVRLADWLVLVAFGAASLSAQRNVFLTAMIAPVVIAAYAPGLRGGQGSGVGGRGAAHAAAATLAAMGLVYGVARGSFFQFRVAEWKLPAGAAEFLLRHRVTGRMFNTYEYGGYLMWRLWPQERVFIDGRALSESVFQDYARILYNHDESDGLKSGEKLMDEYGLEVIVMNTFEASGGTVYMLAPSLADPNQTRWKLVYQDAQAVVFMRTPPAGVEPLNSLEIFTHMESECTVHLEHEPRYTRCARSLGQIFTRLGDYPRARKWVGIYLEHPHEPDPQAEEAWQRLIGMGQ